METAFPPHRQTLLIGTGPHYHFAITMTATSATAITVTSTSVVTSVCQHNGARISQFKETQMFVDLPQGKQRLNQRSVPNMPQNESAQVTAQNLAMRTVALQPQHQAHNVEAASAICYGSNGDAVNGQISCCERKGIVAASIKVRKRAIAMALNCFNAITMATT